MPMSFFNKNCYDPCNPVLTQRSFTLQPILSPSYRSTSTRPFPKASKYCLLHIRTRQKVPQLQPKRVRPNHPELWSKNSKLYLPRKKVANRNFGGRKFNACEECYRIVRGTRSRIFKGSK